MNKQAKRGRPRIAEPAQSTVIHARVSVPQSDKYKSLGGAGWLRDRINKAKEPKA